MWRDMRHLCKRMTIASSYGPNETIKVFNISVAELRGIPPLSYFSKSSLLIHLRHDLNLLFQWNSV